MDDFEKLLCENKSALERYVRFKINNHFDADDIIQDVCLTAFRKFDDLKNKLSFKAWLISIAKNKCNAYYLQKAQSTDISLDMLPERTLSIKRYGVTVHDTVSETLDLLGDKEKQILYLYFFQELSQEAIAQCLNIPLGTVKSRLHYAKQKFREKYPYPPHPKGATLMKKLPEIMPEYTIQAVDAPAFPVVFEELSNWFIIPRTGEEITWASYDMPSRKMTEQVLSKAVCPAFIHGIEGVEISTEFKNHGSDYGENSVHIYYAQLTQTHCRWLGESYTDKNGAKRLLTFLDGDDFISEWGYGEDNCGNETHLKPSGIITRTENTVSAHCEQTVLDIVGRYLVKINGKEYDTVCIMEWFDNGVLTEQFIDQNGRTVLWRRFNKNDWANNHYGKLWTELLPGNEQLFVNGELYVHWYDCITDYIL